MRFFLQFYLMVTGPKLVLLAAGVVVLSVAAKFPSPADGFVELQHCIIYSVYKKERPEFYSGAINFSLGLSNETKRKNIIETSVYYQYGLGNIGAEATQRSFLGVRSVYWFKIK